MHATILELACVLALLLGNFEVQSAISVILAIFEFAYVVLFQRLVALFELTISIVVSIFETTSIGALF